MHLPLLSDIPSPQFVEHKALSEELTRMAITVEGAALPPISRPFLLILDEDRAEKGRISCARSTTVTLKSDTASSSLRMRYLCTSSPAGDILVAVFSTVKAWKRGAPQWLQNALDALQSRATASFPSETLCAQRTEAGQTRIHAYWDSEAAQEAVAEKLAVSV